MTREDPDPERSESMAKRVARGGQYGDDLEDDERPVPEHVPPADADDERGRSE